MRNRRRPTSWLLGFAGSAVVHACLLAALFAFGRVAPVGAQPGAEPSSDAIALTAVYPAFAGADPIRGRHHRRRRPPDRAWDAREGDRDNPCR